MSTGFVDPDRAQFEAFKGLDRNHPIDMLNLVRFRTKASYPSDHALASTGLTGAQAYAIYGSESGPVLKKVGGAIVWRGQFETTLIGPQNAHWDAMFIARYPTAHAFLAMISDPAYKQAVIHRQAAVDTSRLICCAPGGESDVFG